MALSTINASEAAEAHSTDTYIGRQALAELITMAIAMLDATTPEQRERHGFGELTIAEIRRLRDDIRNGKRLVLLDG